MIAVGELTLSVYDRYSTPAKREDAYDNIKISGKLAYTHHRTLY